MAWQVLGVKARLRMSLAFRNCRSFSRAYLRHLFKAEEMLAMRLAVMHNLWFYNTLMERIREALDQGAYGAFREEYSEKLGQRYPL